MVNNGIFVYMDNFKKGEFMNKFDRIALYLFGILLVLGIFFIGFEIKQVNDELYEIEVRMDYLNSTLQ
ncbi:MAG: hypothetical protein K0R71_763 [Bacillales bacterium]|jgi:hypothetical protein|nr:hypothetical protein [Bacillales bacterium]